jgi:hypothetical protein
LLREYVEDPTTPKSTTENARSPRAFSLLVGCFFGPDRNPVLRPQKHALPLLLGEKEKLSGLAMALM